MKKGKTGRRLLIALAMLVLLAVTVSAAMLHNDYNGDGQVGSQDAVYLFKHLKNPKTYPISQSGDVDGDGQKDQADALYLLRHSLNPEKYPLEERHTEEIIPGKTATCTETGLTEGLRCSVCEAVLKEQEVIPALGHQPDESNWKTNVSRHWRSCRRSGCVEELNAGEHVYTDWLLVEAGGCSLQDYHVRACRTCGHCETDLPDNVLHAHVWTMESKAATCTEEGYEAYVHCVNCDKVAYRENLPALGHDFKNAPYTSTEYNHKQTCQRENCTVELTGSHSWGDWIVDRPETCTADGSKHRICYECKYRGEETIPAGHILTQVDAKAPTCTEVGHNAYEYCTRCSHSTYQEKAALGHMVNTKLYDKDSSHHWHYCSRGNCSYTEGKAVHSFGGWTVRRGATCTEAGVEYRSCVCGYEETRLLPAPGHQMSETYEKNEDGHWLICLRAYCGYKTEVQDHEYGAWTEIKPAKCEETGKKERSCTLCGYAQQEVIPELGHDYAGAQWSSDEETHWKNCLRSGCTSGISQGKHSWSAWITDIPAQCEAAGSKHRTCEICERRVEEMIPALGHSYFGEWQYDDQNHWKECIHDGCTQKDSLDSHSFGGWTVRQEPTCTAQGEEYRRCICGYEETRPMAIVDHLLSDTYEKNSGGHWQKCTRSGCEYKTETQEHTYSDWTVTVPAECEKNGYQEHACAVCDYVESETIPALRHMTGDWIPGENQHYMHCDRCGLNHNYQNHDWQITEHAATCETGAYKLSECHVCGFSKEETTGKPLGHNWETDYNETYHWEVCRRSGCGLQTVAEPHTMGQWETVTAADCEEKGEEERKCTGCKYTETREIGPNGHSWSVKLTVAPGCVTEGYTLYECGSCGKTESRDVKEPLGHTDGQNNTNWHKDDGDSHWLICIRCGQNYEKADHSWSDWQTLTPAACETEGRQRRSCSVCGRQEEEAIPATGHNHSGSWVQGSSTHYKLCANDGCQEILDEKAHSKGSIQRNNAFHFYTCTVCGKTPLEQEVHTYGDWQTVTAATCTEKGLQKHYCTACSWEDILTNTLDKLPHDLYVTVDTRQIQQTGETVYAHTVVEKCRYECDYYAVIGETAVHVHNEVDTVITPATCTEPGSVVVKCKVPGCGDVFLTEELPPLGHHVVDGVCTRCGEGNFSSEGLKFTLSSDKTYYIVSGIGTCKDTKIHIPDTHLGKPVQEIGRGAFAWNSTITSVIIPDSVTVIEESAFFACIGLTDVTIGNGVVSVGVGAFQSCTGLTELTIPDSVTTLGDYSFASCTGLTGLVIGKSVETIGESAFLNCSGLKELTVSESVAVMGKNAFGSCFYLENIRFNAAAMNDLDVKTAWIYDPFAYAGQNGNGLTVTIGSNVTKVPACLFRENTAITQVIFAEGSTCETIGAYAFYHCENLTHIGMADSVKMIEAYAFCSCDNLETVTIGKGVTTVGESAFDYCTGITEITVPVTVTNIGDKAFRDCTGLETIYYEGTTAQWNQIQKGTDWDLRCDYELICLGDPKPSEGLEFTLSNDGTYYIVSGIGTCTDTEIVIPSTHEGKPVKAIGDKAFYEQTNINSVTIPDSVTSVGSFAFYNCRSLTEISIPEGVTSIGSSAFKKCSSLAEITIPDSVTSIGYDAFYNCSSLTEISIPDSVTSIGGWAFYNCRSLTGVYISDLAAWCKISFVNSSANPLYNAHKLYLNYELVTVLNIPNGITGIGHNAFINCSSLTEINIPDGVTGIGDSAFSGCSSLTEINIPDGVTGIGDDAFSGCSSLTEITIPGGVTSIGSSAFSGCSSLTEISIPDSVTSIGDWAFSGCSSLTRVEIPEGVTSIGDYAFYDCSSLTEITIPDSVTSIGDYAFSYCSSLTRVVIPEGVTSIGDYAFRSCSSLTEITIPDSVTSIGNYAFLIGGEMTGIWVNENNPSYSSDERGVLFNKNKTELVQAPGGISGIYRIPDSVTSMGNYAFYDCSNLTEITIPDGVTSIGDYAFYDCSSLTEITIPEGVTSIGRLAFYNCRSLTGVYISDLAAWCKISFGDSSANPLYNAHKLYLKYELVTVLNIPNGITGIGDYAFINCSSLTEIDIPDGVTSIGGLTFSWCSSLTEITIPESVTSIGNSAFSACRNLTDVYYGGTEDQWEQISIESSNTKLTNAARYYYSETQPVSEPGKYWHYVDGKPTLWA